MISYLRTFYYTGDSISLSSMIDDDDRSIELHYRSTDPRNSKINDKTTNQSQASRTYTANSQISISKDGE